ncbi:MAG: HesA/MoeB/ThiF family protein [Qingshengfaniella sp.]
MLLFLALAGGLWALGWVLRTPRALRWTTIGLLYVAFVAVLVLLPAGHPLRGTMGGSAAEWLVIGALGLAIWAYSRWIGQLRGRIAAQAVVAVPAKDPNAPLTEAELDRYARHIVLREVGGPGQRALKRARVLVVGAGGLGAPMLQYLAAAGVGTIGVIDDDTVSASNLQRQVIHGEDRLGLPKVFSAERAMKALNPHITVRPYNRRLDEGIAGDLVADYDLVLDGSDNFDTRYLVNRACVAARVPLIAGAIAQWEGQISLYDPAHGGPCFACVFPKAPGPGLAPACAEAGVIGPLPGVIGTMMAVEAIKHLTGAGAGLAGRLMIYDGLYGENRIIAVKRRGDCPVCGTA